MPNQPDGTIQILRTPRGEAPEWVRKAWVGCSLSCFARQYVDDNTGVVSRMVEKRSEVYIVDQAVAIEALERNAPHAAAWWRSQGFPQPGKSFSFDIDCARELTYVPRPRLIVANEEMGFQELPGR